jgi:hypothetical protein
MTVAEILQQVELLSYEERKELMKHLIDKLDAPPRKSRHLSELRGLGHEIWQGIDAQQYVDELRNEWDDRGDEIWTKRVIFRAGRIPPLPARSK